MTTVESTAILVNPFRGTLVSCTSHFRVIRAASRLLMAGAAKEDVRFN